MEAGEEIVVARHGRPVARLIPYRIPRAARKPGQWRGQGWIAPDFDETPEEVIRSLEDGEP